MKITRATHIAAAVFTATLVLVGCSKNSAVPKTRGVFYQPAQGKLVPLFNGTATEMLPRSIAITGTARPSFSVSVPGLSSSNIRIGVSLADNKAGPFQAVDIVVTPVEGEAEVYKVQPSADLPQGLCAVIIGGKNELSTDTNNVYPFRVEAASQ